MFPRKIKTSEQIICYIDILGYNYLINKLGQDVFLNIVNSIIHKFNDITRKKLRFIQKDIEFCVKAFSDNIIISSKIPDPFYPNFPRQRNDTLLMTSFILEFVRKLQINLIIDHGIFIRGGITKGDLYINNNFVFGNGLIKAYELESKVALYPRIIIDKNLSDFSNKELHYNRMEQLIFKLDDGVPFLDYLNLIETCSVDIKMRRKEIITENDIRGIFYKHKKVIEENLVCFSKNEKIYNKYKWCYKYHNIKCMQRDWNEYLIRNLD